MTADRSHLLSLGLGHLLAQRTGQAAISGPAAQAASAEVVEAVQQARALVLCMAQRAHEGMATGSIQGTQALQRRKNCSRHLRGWTAQDSDRDSRGPDHHPPT